MEGTAGWTNPGKEETLARTNYQWEKRQRDLAKKKKKEEKLRKKQALREAAKLRQQQDSEAGATAAEGEEE